MQEKRLAQEIADIEKDTGFKLRVLAQNYPETPGLAIRDFWKVDDRTIVFVADPTFGNILNFNVGASVDLDIPRSFWSRLAGKYGNIFYWKEKVRVYCCLMFFTFHLKIIRALYHMRTRISRESFAIDQSCLHKGMYLLPRWSRNPKSDKIPSPNQNHYLYLFPT
nr:thylakoid lumenal 15.0 kDa protein 2, chloroplastic [Ipomoea batatas]